MLEHSIGDNAKVASVIQSTNQVQQGEGSVVAREGNEADPVLIKREEDSTVGKGSRKPHAQLGGTDEQGIERVQLSWRERRQGKGIRDLRLQGMQDDGESLTGTDMSS